MGFSLCQLSLLRLKKILVVNRFSDLVKIWRWEFLYTF
jgi:hypothetical protein